MLATESSDRNTGIQQDNVDQALKEGSPDGPTHAGASDSQDSAIVEKAALEALLNQTRRNYSVNFPGDFVDPRGILMYRACIRSRSKTVRHAVIREAETLNRDVIHPLLTEAWGVIRCENDLRKFEDFAKKQCNIALQLDMSKLLASREVYEKVAQFIQVTEQSKATDLEISTSFYFIMYATATLFGWDFYRLYDTATLVGGLVTFDSDTDAIAAVMVSPRIFLSDASKRRKVTVHGRTSKERDKAFIDALHAGLGHRLTASVVIGGQETAVLWFDEIDDDDVEVYKFSIPGGLTESEKTTTVLSIATHIVMLISEPRPRGGASISKNLKLAGSVKVGGSPVMLTSGMWESVNVVGPTHSLVCSRLKGELRFAKHLFKS